MKSQFEIKDKIVIADILNNALASFSVVEPYSMIQSYFSSTGNLACPATHL